MDSGKHYFVESMLSVKWKLPRSANLIRWLWNTERFFDFLILSAIFHGGNPVHHAIFCAMWHDSIPDPQRLFTFCFFLLFIEKRNIVVDIMLG